ncbi:MAG TPA: ATP-binding protein [Allosphingosinicella sp.]|nr:ATP-binding protein [Allosphingosinicella sp.]
MAEEATVSAAEEGGPPSWRALWVSAGALAATLALVALIVMITISNRARDEALGWERRTNDLVLVIRQIDAAMARSEAALSRYVLDGRRSTGTAYYSERRNAGFQIGQLRQQITDDPAQARRVEELGTLFERRGEELARAVAIARREPGYGPGVRDLLERIVASPLLPAMRRRLEEIADAERAHLARRMAATQGLVTRADTYTDWLGWLGVLIGLGAVGLAILAWRAFIDGVQARREADAAGWHALDLEQAVQARTRELSDANARLKQEAAERAAAEAQLRQVQKMEAVGQLTGGIAHDFNNMLAVVVGGLDLARRKLHGSRREVEFHLDNAMEGATRAAGLTRRLLAFARAEPLLPEAVAPAELVENMLELIDRAIGERITVHTRFAAGNWHVWADPTQFENAILNLAVNARDAMGGRGDLSIEVDNVTLKEAETAELPAGDYVRVCVVDKGVGIAPEHLDRVFEPFFTTKAVGKGTGLGLSQIFGFARQSGGDVAIASALGRGTKVSIYLPRSAAAAEQASGRIAPTLRHAEPAVRSGSAAAILVVEDDPRVSRSTVAALEELGYRPYPCASGKEALAMLKREAEIALVVTDVMMPEMTGTELAAEVKRRRPGMRILFVTGYVGEAGDAGDLSGHAVLRKPFTVNALSAAVESALGGVNGQESNGQAISGQETNGLRPAATDEAAE